MGPKTKAGKRVAAQNASRAAPGGGYANYRVRSGNSTGNGPGMTRYDSDEDQD